MFSFSRITGPSHGLAAPALHAQLLRLWQELAEEVRLVEGLIFSDVYLSKVQMHSNEQVLYVWYTCAMLCYDIWGCIRCKDHTVSIHMSEQWLSWNTGFSAGDHGGCLILLKDSATAKG